MHEPDDRSDLFTDRSFRDLELPPEIQRAVDDLGFSRLTRVQDEVLPITLAGRDVAAQAQTGTGKTAAYLITIYTHCLTTPRQTDPRSPRALILAPTRELAVQVGRDSRDLGRHCDLTTHMVFGGIDYDKQRRELAADVDILVGTPGRLIDYYKQHVYTLDGTELLVIDECDRLFDMGFADDLHWILRRLPKPADRQSMMFTATLSYRVLTLGWRQMNDPAEVVVNPEAITPDTISQVLYHVGSREKFSLLLGILETQGASRTMIFVNTREWAERVAEALRRDGYQVRQLTGNVRQKKRLRVLDEFKEGRLPILIATDVASRGLHIEGVSHVINYDLPQDPEDYVHRIGRTARAGAEGKAISLACENYVLSLDAIHKFVGYEIPVAFADDELFRPVKHSPHRLGRRSGGKSAGRRNHRSSRRRKPNKGGRRR